MVSSSPTAAAAAAIRRGQAGVARTLLQQGDGIEHERERVLLASPLAGQPERYRVRAGGADARFDGPRQDRERGHAPIRLRPGFGIPMGVPAAGRAVASCAMRIVKLVGIVVGALVLLMGGAVGYASATGETKLSFPDTEAPRLNASKDLAVIDRGRYLVHGPAHCVHCHGADGDPHPENGREPPLPGGRAFPMGPLGTRYARNLTPDPETGIGGLSDEQLARVLRTGVTHDGQLSFFMTVAAPNLSDDDIVAVISYLRSREPVRNAVRQGEWSVLGKILLTYVFPPMKPRSVRGPVHVPPAPEPSLARGEYLVEHVAICGGCHTAFDMDTFQQVGPKVGGSFPEPSHGPDQDMEFVAPNLTSHVTGYTGKVPEDLFVTRLRAGRVHATSLMPWECFGTMTDADLRSISRFLKSLPAAENDVGPTYRKLGWKRGQG